MTAKEEVKTGVLHYMHMHTQRLLQLGRARSSDMLKATANRFMEFRGGRDCPLDMLDSDMMQLFEAHLKRRGLSRNTIGFYMRTMRTAYNTAVERGVTANRNPFRRVYTGKDKTVKRALAMGDMQALSLLDLAARPNLGFARDMFMFSFMARGMALVDMAYLRKRDLEGTHCTYRRRKTGQPVTIEWMPEMQDIIDKYAPNPTAYLLPLITRHDKPDRRQYLNQAEKVNRALKEVARLAGVAGNLTMYCARHTWSTLARDKGIPITVISEALGHDSIKTTQIYLDSIKTNVVDAANRAVIADILAPQ